MDGAAKGKGDMVALKGKLAALKGKGKGKWLGKKGLGEKGVGKANEWGSSKGSGKGKGGVEPGKGLGDVKVECEDQGKGKGAAPASTPAAPTTGPTAVADPGSGVPPTMISGYGGVSKDELKQDPAKVLGDHETRVRDWLKPLGQRALVENTVKASKHPMFEKYLSSVRVNRKWGLAGNTIEDLCEFDVWLKKLAMSDLKSSSSPVTPPSKKTVPVMPPKAAPPRPAAETCTAEPPAPSTADHAKPLPPNEHPPRAAKPAVPKACAATPAPKNDDMAEELTPEQRAGYQHFWKQFSKKNANNSALANLSPTSPASTSVPSPSEPVSSPAPASETGITPDCKKRLSLDSPTGPQQAAVPKQGAFLRKSTSMMSDGSGDVEMDKLVEGSGRTKRVKTLTPEDAERIKAMTSIDDLPPDERKRQREALRRRMQGQGLKPGLLAKYNAASTSDEKFEFLKSFMLDPSLNSVEVEAEYVDQNTSEDASNWVEIPLKDIRAMHGDSDEGKRFVQKIVDSQDGRQHPQDVNNDFPEWRLYWVFKENSDTKKHTNSIAHRTRASSHVPDNKTARQCMADSMTNVAAGFGKGKGGPGQSHVPPSSKGGKSTGKKGGKGKKTGKGDSKGKTKTMEEIEKQTFDATLDKTTKLAAKARNAAEALKSTGIVHQEATIKNLGVIYNKCTSLVKQVSDEIFNSKPFAEYKLIIERASTFLEEADQQVRDACIIKESFDRRLAAEKRKAAAKCNPKGKAKAKAAPVAPVAAAEVPEEWPEDDDHDGNDAMSEEEGLDGDADM